LFIYIYSCNYTISKRNKKLPIFLSREEIKNIIEVIRNPIIIYGGGGGLSPAYKAFLSVKLDTKDCRVR